MNGIVQTLFNGKDFTGWVNMNNAPGAWLIDNAAIYSAGKVPANLRSEFRYQNYRLEFDCFIFYTNTEAAIIIHSEALPAIGQSTPKGIQYSLNNPGHTIPGSWNHFNITCENGSIKVVLNGKTINQRKTLKGSYGYLSFAAIQGEFKVRNIQLTELPGAAKEGTFSPDEFAGFLPLYNNTDLSGWKMLPGHFGHWTAQDWKINYDGKSAEQEKSLWTEKSYRNFILVADFRLTRKPAMAKSPVVLPSGENVLNKDGTNQEVDILYAGDTGIYLRGNDKSQVNIGYRYLGSGEIYGYRVDKSLSPAVRAGATPKVKADHIPGEWNRLIITMKDEYVSVSLNGIIVIDNALLPGIPATGPIALQDDHANNNTFQFANLFIREIN